MALSVLVGIAVWPVVYALKELVHWLFHEVIHWVDHATTPLVLLIPLLIGAAITAAFAQYRAIWVTYQTDDGKEELNAVAGDGVERTIALYRTSELPLGHEIRGPLDPNPRMQFPTFQLAVRKFFATLATLGGGASGGLEGSAALIGESMGAGLYGAVARLTNRDQSALARYEAQVINSARVRFLQTAQIGGVAAAVTVLLGAPLTSAFFATEVMYRDRPLFEKLFYGLISSLAAYILTVLAFGKPVLFHIEAMPEPAQGGRYALVLILVAILVTVVGQLYRVFSDLSNDWFQRAISNAVYRHLVGAVLVGAVALATVLVMNLLNVQGSPLELVLGSGETAIVAGLDLATTDQLSTWVALVGLVASMLATLATISSGGSAGLLVPSLFFGSMVAVVAADLSGFLPMHLVPPAMTASLVAIAGTPITALLFVVEVFGASWIIPAVIVLVIAFLMANPNSIYRTRQDAPDRDETVPGMDVRRFSVPASLAGKTWAELDLEERFDVQIIGLYRKQTAAEDVFQQEIDPGTVLQAGDVLTVSGPKEALDLLGNEFSAQQIQA